MSFDCVLSCVVSGVGPDILLTLDSEIPVLLFLSSILANSLCSHYRRLTYGHFGCK